MKHFYLSLSILLLIGLAESFNVPTKTITKIVYKTKYVQVQDSTVAFSKDNLDSLLNRLNLRFPDIAMAQSIHETGNFESNLFKNNNNLFGMKVAKRRPCIAIGERNGFAYYASWQESVIDYALYVAAYMKDCKTKDQFFNKLSGSYASGDKYVGRLKSIISKQQ